jgi:hypothetical protein
MVVKTQRDGRDHTGLHIGAANARRHFRKGARVVDLMLDDLQIQCTLSPDFWKGRPEVHDPRLSEWLEFKAGYARPGRAPMLLTMVRSGIDTFVVKPKSVKRHSAFGEEVSMGKPVKSEARISPGRLPVLEPRFIA